MKGSVKKYAIQGEKPGVELPRWYYVVDLGTDPATGKRLQERRRGFATQREANKAMRKRLSDISENRVDLTGRNITLDAWLDTWLEQKKANGLSAGTLRAYRGHIDRYLKPLLGKKKLVDITPADVEWLMGEIRKPRSRNKGRGSQRATTPMGPATARRVHATLRAALTRAVKRHYITFNAAADVELPDTPHFYVEPWHGDDLRAFLKHTSTEKDGSLFELYAMTGLRRGELLGLRWSDVNLTTRIILVRQQLTENPLNVAGPNCEVCGEHHGSVAFGDPKTEKGKYRRVPIPSDAMGALLAHRLAQDELRATNEPIWLEHDLVFSRDDGTPLLPSGVSKRFQTLTEEAGLRRVRLHDLRHGYASMLISAGKSIAEVSKIMGHSSIKITVDTYGHLTDEDKLTASDDTFRGLSSFSRDHAVTTDPNLTNGLPTHEGQNR